MVIVPVEETICGRWQRVHSHDMHLGRVDAQVGEPDLVNGHS